MHSKHMKIRLHFAPLYQVNLTLHSTHMYYYSRLGVGLIYMQATELAGYSLKLLLESVTFACFFRFVCVNFNLPQTYFYDKSRSALK
jgi:hypothetical protein